VPVPTINSVPIPTSMAYEGVFDFQPQSIGTKNGEGDAVLAGPQRAFWHFDVLTPDEWTWWTTTIMGGTRKASIDITSAILWDDVMGWLTFTDGKLYMPTKKAYTAGQFWDITIEFGHLLPLVLS